MGQTAAHAAELYVLPGLLPAASLEAVLGQLDSLDVALDTDPGAWLRLAAPPYPSSLSASHRPHPDISLQTLCLLSEVLQEMLDCAIFEPG